VLLSLDRISKNYAAGDRPVAALRNISLDIAEGEFVAIMGPSGSGKSTLMNIIGLLDRPDGGAYYLDGEDVSGLDDQRRSYLRNRMIGFIFQNFNLLPRSNAIRNVALPLTYRAVSESERMKRAEEILQTVGLADRVGHLPNQLSGGERQRVAIARALAGEPKMILADEPTGNLDRKTGDEIIAILRSLASTGKTILMVTHDPHSAEAADRTVSMMDGEIISL